MSLLKPNILLCGGNVDDGEWAKSCASPVGVMCVPRRRNETSITRHNTQEWRIDFCLKTGTNECQSERDDGSFGVYGARGFARDFSARFSDVRERGTVDEIIERLFFSFSLRIFRWIWARYAWLCELYWWVLLKKQRCTGSDVTTGDIGLLKNYFCKNFKIMRARNLWLMHLYKI